MYKSVQCFEEHLVRFLLGHLIFNVLNSDIFKLFCKLFYL